MSPTLPQIASNWTLKRWIPTLVSNDWAEVIPSNPSRWHLVLIASQGMQVEFSPFKDLGADTGLFILDDDNFIEFRFPVSSALTTSAWYVRCPVVIPTGTVQAWETTLTGT
jgi:hypothetical protein